MIKNILKDIQNAIPKIKEEDACLDKKHGIDRKTDALYFGEEMIARSHEENKAKTDLEKMLMTYDDESLLMAKALLYYGRNDKPSAFKNELDRLRSRKAPKEEIVGTIMGKLPAFKVYIESALRKFKVEGLIGRG